MASKSMGIEAVGLVLGSFSLVITASQQFSEIAGYNLDDYGFLHTILLHTIFWKAPAVIQRVRTHVLGNKRYGAQNGEVNAREALAIQTSYAASFNMISVAGAILAQIAITALSLEGVNELHWTVTAAFLISLIAGLLSVYYACIIQVRLSGMHSPDDVRQWLTARQKSPLGFSKEVPSYYSALLLTAPGQLLNWSVFSLLIGIGIYYGLIFTEDLGKLGGTNPNLAILLVYVLFTAGASAIFVLPDLAKLNETAPRERVVGSDLHRAAYNEDVGRRRDIELGMPRMTDEVRGDRVDVGASPQTRATTTVHQNGDKAIAAALEASISAQTASLEAQRVLLQAYRVQSEVDTERRRHSL